MSRFLAFLPIVVTVKNTLGFHLNLYNAFTFVRTVGMCLDLDRDVIVQIPSLNFRIDILRRQCSIQRTRSSLVLMSTQVVSVLVHHVLLISRQIHYRSSRKIVHDPIHTVLLINLFLELFHIFLVVLLSAQHLASLETIHVQLVRRVLDLVSG